jgi:F1F0 ATPase subunit 2
MVLDWFSGFPGGIGGLVLAIFAGALLGILYFGGLWYTVRQMHQVERPVLLFTGSFLVRSVLTLAGFFLVSDGRIERLAACLISFFVTRQILFRLVRTEGN